MNRGNKLSLQVVAYFSPEDECWIAHCLEMDIIGHGDTAEEAARCLDGAIKCHLKAAFDDGVDLFRPAPREIQEMYLKSIEIQARKDSKSPPEFNKQLEVAVA